MLAGGIALCLREHTSLRNVEAVASLTPQAQERLVEGIHSGLRRWPRAVVQLMQALLEKCDCFDFEFVNIVSIRLLVNAEFM